MADYFDTSEDFFSEEGPLAKLIDGYQPREAQRHLSAQIEKTINSGKLLIAEAGTGTGKTFAYLVPALLSGKKVIISTGTKHLQDQLFHRDLPTIRTAFDKPIKLALLKGRSNYLCKYRLETCAETDVFHSKQLIADLHVIKAKAARSRTGEVGEITDVPENSPAWYYATSTIDNCLGKECDFYNDCHLIKARRKALESEVVVVNHHLLFSDLGLKDEGEGELLPNADLVIVDEAHQFPEIASQFFSTKISSRQLLRLATDIEIAQQLEAGDMKQLISLSERLKTAVKNMRLQFGLSATRAPWKSIVNTTNLKEAIDKVAEAFLDLIELLGKAAERGKELKKLKERSQALLNEFELLTSDSPNNKIHWYETTTQSFSIHFAPMSVAQEFRAHVDKDDRKWVFTSATLAVDQAFSHFSDQLGLDDAECLQVDSPFDYANQSLLYLPRGLPDPNHLTYLESLVNAAVPVINAAEGRTFFLFTSHKALKQAAELLSSRVDYPLLIQGSKPKDVLLKEYRALGNAVLLGTNSFWEGVDVRGEALSCVIIDKLPFVMPDDPIVQARGLALKKQGKDVFSAYQIPRAVITLKQGVGRLIRDINDRGVLMLCDPRLLAREYGRIFVKSLPPFPRTRELEKVLNFYT